MYILHRNGKAYLTLEGLSESEAKDYAAKLGRTFPKVRWTVTPAPDRTPTAGERLMPGCTCGAARNGTFQSCRCD